MKYPGFSCSSLMATKMIAVVCFFAMFMSAMASSQDSLLHESDTTKKTYIFVDYEQAPHFRGGNVALQKYLNDNIKYPPQALKDSVQGRVVVKMLIDSLGYVTEVQVFRSVREDLDQEAVRVCKSLPRFSPGRQYGKCVNEWLYLPVTFKIGAPDNPVVEEPKPEFPGGNRALRQYLSSYGHFPAELLKTRSHGWVEVDILVDAKGRVDAVKVDESYDESLDREVIRVLQTLPRFIPCRENGVPVSKWVKYTVFYSRNPEQPIMYVRSE